MRILTDLIILIVLVTLSACSDRISVKVSSPSAITSKPSLSYAGAVGTTGTLGSAMSVSPTTLNSGGTAITACTSSPALPSWATINASTCVISGTPNATLASTTYTITATNATGSNTATVTLVVGASAPTISYVGSFGTSGVVGSPMSVSPAIFNSNGAIASCSISPALSAGLVINSSTCLISGTPTAVSPATIYTVTATNTEGSSTASVTLTVGAGIPIISYTGATGTSGTVGTGLSVTPTTLNDSGAAITACSSSPTLPAWATINASTCVISGTPNAVLASTTYTITATNAAGFNTASVTLAVAALSPTISYAGATGTTGTVGTTMSISPTTLNNRGAAITACTASPALPSWASIDSSACVISGTPDASLTSTTYTVTATNYVGSNSATVTLLVNSAKRLAFQSMKTNRFIDTCMGPFSIALKDSANLHFSPAPSLITVDLSDDGSGVSEFYKTPDCSDAPVSTVTILTGESVSSEVYFKSSDPGDITITADDSAGAALSVSRSIKVVDKVPDTWVGYSETGVPAARYMHSAIWTGSEMIIWGGNNLLNTGGRYNPVSDTWGVATSISDAPTGRAGHSAIWTGSEMIIWGGANEEGSIFLNTGGRYNPATDTWGAATSTAGAPTARAGHSTIWTGSEMIIWGGVDELRTLLNNGSRYNPATDTWETVSSTGAPSARYMTSAIWTGSEMIIWGGMEIVDDELIPLNTGGRYDPASDSWGAATSITGAPIARGGHSAIWTGSEMILWGGTASNTGARYDPVADTWGAATSTAGAPLSRMGHTAIWTGSEMIVWGGLAGNLLSSGIRYNPVTDTWGAEISMAQRPDMRGGHSAIWTESEMIIWGGDNGNGFYLNSGVRYTPSTDSWSAMTSTTGAPTARSEHSAIWTGVEMIIWGGEDNNSDMAATGGRYNPVTDSWGTETSTVGAPTARYLHSAIWTGSEMIIWGGDDFINSLDTGARYNPTTDSWSTPISATGAPSPRESHSAIWTGSEMLIWGGADYEYYDHDGDFLKNTGGRYDPATDTWGTPTSTSGAPGPRASHSAIWTGSEMIIWGGADFDADDMEDYYLNSGGRYDPATDSWGASPSTTGAPLCEGHSAIWTSSEMIIWGGWTPTGATDVYYYIP